MHPEGRVPGNVGGPIFLTDASHDPGGDFFEGVAIYNALRQHKAKVNINILGLAASAGSVIAMAGDEIQILVSNDDLSKIRKA